MKLNTAKHAFITGGASGIGLAVARALVEKGLRVTVADVNADALAEEIAVHSEAWHSVVLDVRDRSGWAAAKAAAEAEFGPVDILINNAGIASFGIPLADMDPDVFDRLIAVDLTGVFNGVSAFAGDMRARGYGHIVNTSSMAGICAPSNGIGGSYAAAKFGVVGLSETLRAELEPHGVGVTILCPGQTVTGIAENSMALGGGVRMPEPRAAATAAPRPPSPFETGTAEELAALLLRGIESNAPYVVAHGRGWWPLVSSRHQAIAAAFEGMRD